MLTPIPEVVSFVLEQGLNKVMRRYQADRVRYASEVLLTEIRKGKPWAINDDKAAAILWRYMRAIQEGAAKLNLAMLAEAIVERATEPRFSPDEFRTQADALASLSRQEVHLIAAFIRHRPSFSLSTDNIDFASIDAEAFIALQREAAFTPLFENAQEVEATCAALCRTGWIASNVGYTDGKNLIVYRPTMALHRVKRLLDWEAIGKRVEEVSEE